MLKGLSLSRRREASGEGWGQAAVLLMISGVRGGGGGKQRRWWWREIFHLQGELFCWGLNFN